MEKGGIGWGIVAEGGGYWQRMEEGWGKRGRKRDEEEEGAKKEMRERGRERRGKWKREKEMRREKERKEEQPPQNLKFLSASAASYGIG